MSQLSVVDFTGTGVVEVHASLTPMTQMTATRLWARLRNHQGDVILLFANAAESLDRPHNRVEKAIADVKAFVEQQA